MTDTVILFPMHRVRLPDMDELWADAVCEHIRGMQLTHPQVLTILGRVDAYRRRYPSAQPGSAPWAELLDFSTANGGAA